MVRGGSGVVSLLIAFASLCVTVIIDLIIDVKMMIEKRLVKVVLRCLPQVKSKIAIVLENIEIYDTDTQFTVSHWKTTIISLE